MVQHVFLLTLFCHISSWIGVISQEILWSDDMQTSSVQDWTKPIDNCAGIDYRLNDSSCPQGTSQCYRQCGSNDCPGNPFNEGYFYRFQSTEGYTNIALEYSICGSRNAVCKVAYNKDNDGDNSWSDFYNEIFGNDGCGTFNTTENFPSSFDDNVNVGVKLYAERYGDECCYFNYITLKGTRMPTTAIPTSIPTVIPTAIPTMIPTTSKPTNVTSDSPTNMPSIHPSSITSNPSTTAEPSDNSYDSTTTSQDVIEEISTTRNYHELVTSNVVSTPTETLNIENETVSQDNKYSNTVIIASSVTVAVLVMIVIGCIFYRKTRNKLDHEKNMNEIMKTHSVSIQNVNNDDVQDEMDKEIIGMTDLKNITKIGEDNYNKEGNENDVCLNDQTISTKGGNDNNYMDLDATSKNDNVLDGEEENDELYKGYESQNESDDDIDDMFAQTDTKPTVTATTQISKNNTADALPSHVTKSPGNV